MEGFEIFTNTYFNTNHLYYDFYWFGVESKADQKMYYLTIICWHEPLPEMRLVLSSLQPLSDLQSLYDIH
jgi:hypothetical protein